MARGGSQQVCCVLYCLRTVVPTWNNANGCKNPRFTYTERETQKKWRCGKRKVNSITNYMSANANADTTVAAANLNIGLKFSENWH